MDTFDKGIEIGIFIDLGTILNTEFHLNEKNLFYFMIKTYLDFHLSCQLYFFFSLSETIIQLLGKPVN